MVARGEGARDLAARPAGADRHPVAERLCNRDDVGADRLVLEGEPPAGTAEPGLHLVENEQDATLVTQAPHGGEIAGRRDHDARLALDRLEENGHNRFGISRLLESGEIAIGDAAESLWERLEGLVLFRLAGGGERRQRASMERAEGGDDDVAIPAANSARELDGALVCLRAGVREEHLASRRRAVADEAVQLAGEGLGELVEEQVRHVAEAMGLRRDGLGHAGVGMPEGHDRDPSQEVEIAAPLVVEQLRPAAGDEPYRRRRVRRHERGRARDDASSGDHHRADALAREQLEQDGVGDAAVEDVGARHTVADGVRARRRLRHHALGDRSGRDHGVELAGPELVKQRRRVGRHRNGCPRRR